MKINRRSLLGMAVGVVTAGAAPAVEDGGKGCKSAIANGHTFVAACPGATATIPRKAGPTRVMIIGAHPDAQVSQFYDWLPWDMGMEAECQALGDRSDIKARNVYLCKYWAAAKVSNAKRFAAAWRAQYPNQPVPKYMEAYEVSEYGRAPETEDFRILLG